MKLQLVPAREGLTWVRTGFFAFARKPLSTVGVFMAFLLGSLLLLSLPTVGPLIVLVLLPAATVGFMITSQQSLAGSPSGPITLLQPLRQTPQTRRLLLQQGVAYTLLTLLCKLLADGLDGGEFTRWQAELGESRSVDEWLTNSTLQFSMLLRVSLAVPVSLLFWHAGALAYWHDIATPKALFFSWIACWRNWSAFVVYSLAWGLVVIAAGVAMALIGLAAEPIAKLLSVPVALSITSAFYASLGATVNGCFEAPTADAPSHQGSETR